MGDKLMKEVNVEESVSHKPNPHEKILLFLTICQGSSFRAHFLIEHFLFKQVVGKQTSSSNDDQEDIGRNKDVPIHNAVFADGVHEEDKLKAKHDRKRKVLLSLVSVVVHICNTSNYRK